MCVHISVVRSVWCGNKNGLNIFQFVMHFPVTWAATTIMNNSLHNGLQAVPMEFLDRLLGGGCSGTYTYIYHSANYKARGTEQATGSPGDSNQIIVALAVIRIALWL